MVPPINIPYGARFGRWTVHGEWRLRGGQREYKATCDCGTKAWRLSSSLRSGGTKSCGCERAPAPVILGKKECSRCGEWRGEAHFDMWKMGVRSPMCKVCSRSYKATPEAAQRRSEFRKTQAFKAKRSAYRKAWSKTEEGRVVVTLAVARRRARKSALPDTFTKQQAMAILSAFRSRCVYCGSHVRVGVNLHWDHLIPVSDRREDNPGTSARNMAPSCVKCNQRKGARTHAEVLGVDAAWMVEARIAEVV